LIPTNFKNVRNYGLLDLSLMDFFLLEEGLVKLSMDTK